MMKVACDQLDEDVSNSSSGNWVALQKKVGFIFLTSHDEKVQIEQRFKYENYIYKNTWEWHDSVGSSTGLSSLAKLVTIIF